VEKVNARGSTGWLTTTVVWEKGVKWFDNSKFIRKTTPLFLTELEEKEK
jgi:hypothetical protein